MDLTDKKTIKELAKKAGLSPNRQSGQNFLLSREVIDRIISVADLQKEDKVLEIGPGFGTLTTAMLETGAMVHAFELDRRLTEFNRRYEKIYPRYKIHQADVLGAGRIINQEFNDLDYKLIANLPYNITSRVLRIFTEKKPRPHTMVVMVQREVAERIAAQPGQMSILSVAVQFHGQVEIIMEVPADKFWPQPEVNSSVIKITGLGQDINGYKKELSPAREPDFFHVVKIGFSSKRKQLQNNLINGFGQERDKILEIMSKIGLKDDIRAQELSVFQWIKLCKLLIHA